MPEIEAIPAGHRVNSQQQCQITPSTPVTGWLGGTSGPEGRGGTGRFCNVDSYNRSKRDSVRLFQLW